MLEKLLRPEIAAVLWCFFICHVTLTGIEHWLLPWLAERTRVRQDKLEARETAQRLAESLKTWAEKNVNPKKLSQFFALPIEDQCRIQNEIVADQERDLAEKRKLEVKAQEQAERDELDKLRRDQELKAQQNPEVQNQRAVDQFARGGW